MKKSEVLAAWKSLEPGNPLKHMVPIPYKTEGSRYGCCGIRIDGTPEFIDAVLSQLKSLLPGENALTRLELSRQKVKRQPGFKAGQNAASDAEVCYIRLHVRGAEGSHLAAYDRRLVDATEQYDMALSG